MAFKKRAGGLCGHLAVKCGVLKRGCFLCGRRLKRGRLFGGSCLPRVLEVERCWLESGRGVLEGGEVKGAF